MTDDLISKSDALKAVDYGMCVFPDCCVMEKLEAVPIQPNIVRCKDCRHYNTMTKGCKRNPSVEPWGDNDFCSYGAKQTERSESTDCAWK